jgi:hypothetical protein
MGISVLSLIAASRNIFARLHPGGRNLALAQVVIPGNVHYDITRLTSDADHDFIFDSQEAFDDGDTLPL